MGALRAGPAQARRRFASNSGSHLDQACSLAAEKYGLSVEQVRSGWKGAAGHASPKLKEKTQAAKKLGTSWDGGKCGSRRSIRGRVPRKKHFRARTARRSSALSSADSAERRFPPPGAYAAGNA